MAEKRTSIIIDKRLNHLSVRNIVRLSSRPFPSFLSNKDMIMIIREMSKKEIIIWSRKGIWGNRNFMAAEKGMEKMVPQKAALDVVRFQNMPRTNMAVTPGLIIPVYSWMN